MDIIQRNFFCLLQKGALGNDEQVEPMSLFKWKKLLLLSKRQEVENIVLKGMLRFNESEQTAVPQQVVDILKSSETLKESNVIELPLTSLSNPILNKRLSKLRFTERHSTNMSSSTLDVLNIIVYNIVIMLNHGLSLGAVLCLGKYIRSQRENIDSAKLDQWLHRLHITRLANIQATMLNEYFGFSEDELPFNWHYEPMIQSLVVHQLNRTNTLGENDDLKFWEGRLGFVHNNTPVLRRKISAAFGYMKYAPIESISNFVKNVLDGLADIEE